MIDKFALGETASVLSTEHRKLRIVRNDPNDLLPIRDNINKRDDHFVRRKNPCLFRIFDGFLFAVVVVVVVVVVSLVVK